MPKMLTVDERFEAIVADTHGEFLVDKMQPWQEPTPKEQEPSESDEPKPEDKPENE
ncbi:hypothetical protein [Nocardiopsis sp. MG754419]|uniref:hypothetical protein n=1 Tax=Nocardiopsis sp. MG754419 TaxID=2259865 RepID=UPI001BAC4449|nr:hypothetical protein [Nocardiopsis sp. MG754419]